MGTGACLEGLGGESRDTQRSLALGRGMGAVKDLPNYWTEVATKLRSIKMLSERQRGLPGEPLSYWCWCLCVWKLPPLQENPQGVPLTLFRLPSPQQKHMSEHLQTVPGTDLSGSYCEVCSPVSTGAFDDGIAATWRGMGLRSSSVPWARV